MTAREFADWLNRMNYTPRQAAEALGAGKRTVDAYLFVTNPNPIPPTAAKLCRHIEGLFLLERGLVELETLLNRRS